jgi:uncharacterized protein YrrD
MLHSIQTLKRLEIGATDGNIGKVEDSYFDDARWAVRYLVADTGGWLSGRTVLISPRSIRDIDWANGAVRVALTREQVEKSPSIDTRKPVSRQHEIEYSAYYGYAPYWIGPDLWGMGMAPGVPLVVPPIDPPVPPAEGARIEHERAAADPHLRSSMEVAGYRVAATDGDIGHVEDFVFDEATWAIRYLVIDTRNWLPGKHVLVSPEWIERIDWSETKVFASLTRHEIETSPEYDPTSLPGRAYEDALHRHYKKPSYWSVRDEPVTPLSGS